MPKSTEKHKLSHAAIKISIGVFPTKKLKTGKQDDWEAIMRAGTNNHAYCTQNWKALSLSGKL